MRSVVIIVMAVTLMTSVSPAQTPRISYVVNAASFLQGLAPGGIISVFGTELTDGSTASAAGAPLPTRLAGASLLLNEVAVPLFFASPGQINAQVPVDTPDNGAASIRVQVERPTGKSTSRASNMGFAEHSPGIFTLDQNGSGPGAILRNSDFSLICPPGRTDCSVNRAARGEVIAIYVVGLGAVDGLVETGKPALAAYPTETAPQVQIGKAAAPVLFSGMTPGFVGLYQVNVVVPRDAPTGDDIHLEMQQGNSWANRVTIAIAPGRMPELERQGGPWTADIRSIAIDPVNPSTLYAGTLQGLLFKSSDRGDHWVAANSGQPLIVNRPYGGTSAISSVVVDPTNPSVVYAAGAGGGENSVVKSVDGGESWEASGSGIPESNVFINQITISPNNPATLYAAANTGLFESRNGGVSWVPTSSTNFWIESLLIDPLHTSTLYAVSTSLRKSIDGGSSWTVINTGIPAEVYVLSMAIDPSDTTILYAGTDRAGVYKSTNGGLSWRPANFGLPASPSQRIVALAIDPADPNIVYAGTGTTDDWNRGWGTGVFKSTDGGAFWNMVNTGFRESAVQVLQLDRSDPRRIYAGTRNGVLRTTDSGASWRSVNFGFPSASVHAISISTLNPDRIYAGTDRGLFRSPDGGMSWEPASFGLRNAGVLDIAIDPDDSSTIYAGCGGVFRSTNGGDAWFPLLRFSSAIPFLVVDPLEPTTIYAATERGRLYMTTDGGDTWDSSSEIGYGLSALLMDPTNPSILYASAGSTVSKSVDGGAKWSSSLELAWSISSLAIDPQSPTILYAGKNGSAPTYVFKTTDGGASWTPADTGMMAGPVTDLAVDPTYTATVYAGSGSGIVFKTTNAAASWTHLFRGLPLRPITSIAIDPARGANVYVGVAGAGVFKSTDGGQTWQPTGMK